MPRVAEELKAAYLLTGSDRPKVERALRRLRDRFGEEAVERLSAQDVSGEDAVAACNAMGLFGGGGRLVLVDGVERWKAPDAKAIAEYLASPAPDTVLALVGEEVRKDSPLAKACGKAGEVLVYEVSKRELPKWVAEQFARHGVKVSAEACRALVELAGDNPHELAGEIDKLALWAGGDEIGEDEIELLVAARADAPPWTLTDAWGRREVAGVLSACESILERSNRSGAIPMLVGQPRCARPPGADRSPSQRRGGQPARRDGSSQRPASIRRPESVRAGAELLRRRAPRGNRQALRSRSRGQGRKPPATRARARADAGCDHAARRLDVMVERQPRAGRPTMPEGYGVPDTEEGVLDWSWAEERLEQALNYWFATTRPDGRPHAMPAWAVWLDGTVYFEGSPLTRRARNIAENPAVVVHLESGDDVVILEGEAHEVGKPERAARRAAFSGVHREVRRHEVRVPSAARAVGPRWPLGDASPGGVRLERLPARHHAVALRGRTGLEILGHEHRPLDVPERAVEGARDLVAAEYRQVRP